MTRKKGKGVAVTPLAPPKATGGGGFVFENDAAAYFIVNMLAARNPFGPGRGLITRVGLQARADGWLLDDIVLTCTNGAAEHRVALSVKAQPVLDDSRLLLDFVRICWQQFLQHDTRAMNPSDDLLGLIIPPTHSEAASQVDELLQLAIKESPGELSRRIGKPGFASNVRREIWTRFRCPRGLAKIYGVTPERTGDLLRRVRIVQLDLDRTISDQTQVAIALCRDLLLESGANEAEALWDAVRALVAAARPRAGSFTSVDLVRDLAARFRLGASPELRSDWHTVSRRTVAALEAIPSKIGGTLAIPRLGLFKELADKVEQNRATVVIGTSGSGKTVLAKCYLETTTDCTPVVWVPSGILEDRDLASLERRWGLSRTLSELFAAPPGAIAYLVVDGVERLSPHAGLANLRALILALRLSRSEGPWRLILTCQPEDWARVHSSLLGTDMPTAWEAVVVPPLSPQELEPAWTAFPLLSQLRLQRHLTSLLSNPKILDVVVRGLVIGAPPDFSRWVGESDLIEWFWRSVVDQPPNGAQRSAFLQRLAESQADAVTAETPLAALAVAELGPLDNLVRDGLCLRVEEKVRFSHDLYGDWARQRILISRDHELSAYVLPRAVSPLWNRAIRLYGLHLLEQSKNADAWEAAMATVTSHTQAPDLVQDLLLEAAVVSANADQLLEKIWPTLEKDDGRLLDRLLGRFLYVATLPNPMVIALAQSLGETFDTFAATQARLPYWPFWLPMLRFLHARSDDALGLAPRHIAEICDTWLRRGADGWPLRREAAELAVRLAENVRDFKRSGGYYSTEDRVDSTVYRAALAAAAELPDRVKAFAFEAAGLVRPKDGARNV
jgi:hypothetical protein